MVLAVLIVVGAVLFGLVFAIVWHWPQTDPAAPHVSERFIDEEVRLHPRLARFLRRRLDPGLVTGLALTAAAAGLVAVGVVLFMIRAGIGLARYDLGASEWAATEASDFGAESLRWATQLGAIEVVIVVAVVILFVERRRTRDVAVPAILALTIAGQAAVSNLIKWLVDRARPDLEPLSGSWGASFPSGHATTAAAAFAVFALLLGRGRSRPTRAALAAGAVGVAGVVAATRVLLGVHWVTDVVAGLALGWGWFALCSMAFGGRLLRFGAPVEEAEHEAWEEQRGTGPSLAAGRDR